VQRHEVGIGLKASLSPQLVKRTGHHLGPDERPGGQNQDDRVRYAELFSKHRRREVDLVTNHEVGGPCVIQLEVARNATTRNLRGVVPA